MASVPEVRVFVELKDVDTIPEKVDNKAAVVVAIPEVVGRESVELDENTTVLVVTIAEDDEVV